MPKYTKYMKYKLWKIDINKYLTKIINRNVRMYFGMWGIFCIFFFILYILYISYTSGRTSFQGEPPFLASLLLGLHRKARTSMCSADWLQ